MAANFIFARLEPIPGFW